MTETVSLTSFGRHVPMAERVEARDCRVSAGRTTSELLADSGTGPRALKSSRFLVTRGGLTVFCLAFSSYTKINDSGFYRSDIAPSRLLK